MPLDLQVEHKVNSKINVVTYIRSRTVSPRAPIERAKPRIDALHVHVP